MPRKDFERRFFGLRPLQPLEIQQNRQRFLWKCLEKTSGDLEKLGKKAWRVAFVPPPLPPPATARRRSRGGARRPLRRAPSNRSADRAHFDRDRLIKSPLTGMIQVVAIRPTASQSRYGSLRVHASRFCVYSRCARISSRSHPFAVAPLPRYRIGRRSCRTPIAGARIRARSRRVDRARGPLSLAETGGCRLLVRRVVQNDGIFTSPRLLRGGAGRAAGLLKPYDSGLSSQRGQSPRPLTRPPPKGQGEEKGPIFGDARD